MKIDNCLQRSPEWFDLKKARIGGTRFGEVISNRKNSLVYDLLGEKLSEFLFPDDYVSDAMQYGIDHEDEAIEKYSEQSGIKFNKVGAILSESNDIHMASPDGLSEDKTIVCEVKCTEDLGIHIQRFFEGPESKYLPQIKNYFAVDSSVQQVHWVSYCPDCEQRPIVVKVFNRSEFESEIQAWLDQIASVQSKVDELYNQFIF